MKPKTLILMATAIVCGLGASYMTSRLLAERGQGDAEVEKVAVLVAKRHLDMATPVRNPADLFEFKEFIRGSEPKGGVSTPEQAKGKYLKHSLRKGDFLALDDLADSMTGIPVPPGMRGVGLRVNAEAIAGGFASLPGSRVDILYTIRRPSDEDSGSGMLLENVLVLAADGTKDRGEGGAIPASVVTVALTPEDAMRVATAKDMGPLTLLVRNLDDQGKSERRRVSVSEVMHRSASAGTIQTVSGGKVEDGTGGESPTVPLLVKASASAKPAVSKNASAKSDGKRNEAQTETPPALAESDPEPEVRKHVVEVVEGEHRRKVVYVLNDNGDVSQEEVTETAPATVAPTPAASGTPAAPPARPQTQPPAAPKGGRRPRQQAPSGT